VTAGGGALARNTALNLAGQAIPLLVGLTAMPSIARGLGTDRLGLLGMGWAVLGYFGVLDFGVGRAATRFAAHALGRGARSEVPAVMWSAVCMQVVTGLLGTVLLLAGTPFLTRVLLRVSPTLLPEAVATFHVLALAIPIVLVSASFRGVLEAAQRFDLVNAVALPGNALNFLIPLIGALAGWGLAPILRLLVVARALTLCVYAALCVRQFPELAREIAPRRAVISQLVSFGAWATVSYVVGPVLDGLDRFVLGAFAGISSVGFYTAPQELVLRTRVVPAALATALFPSFSTTFTGERQLALVRRQYGLSIRFILLALAPWSVTLVFLGPDVLRVWLCGRFAAESGTALKLLAMGVLLNAVAFVPYAFLHGINRPDIPAKFHLLELPLFLGLAWLLMPRWSVTGAAGAWAVRAVVDSCLLLWAARRLGASAAPGSGSTGFRVWLGIVALTLTSGLLRPLATWSGATRVSLAALLCALVLFGGWFGALQAGDRARIRGLFDTRRATAGT